MKIKEESKGKELKMTEEQEKYELTTDEAGRLEELETVIAENFQGFYAVGCALAEISASKLYRLTHNTFEDYCRERFEVARQTAYQYIEAKGVMDNVRNCGQFELLPANEAQVRPLTRLKTSEEQIQAWEKVVSSSPQDESGAIVTAKHVSQVVGAILGEILTERTNKIKKEISPVVSQKFTDAIWALVEVIREEVAQPMKAKTRKIMVENINRVQQLLSD